MNLSDNDILDLKNALLSVEFGKVEIHIHEGIIVSIAVTKITNKVLTKRNKCVVSNNRKSS